MTRDTHRPLARLDPSRRATLSHEGSGEEPATAPPHHVVVARIGAPHGVRGEVRLQVFTEDPEALRALGPFQDAAGRRTLVLAAMRAQGDHFVARFEGVGDRDAAQMLRNMTLHVPRDRLPAIAEEDSFYIADLVGLAVHLPDGAPAGRVVAVHNFGAGDILEVQPAAGGPTALLPFTRAAVPVVDVAGGRVGLADADLVAPAAPRRDEP